MEGREAISGAGSAPPQPQPQPQPQPPPPPVAPPASSATPPPAPVPLSTAPPSLEVVKMENASQSVGVEATGPAPAPATAAPSVIQATVQPPTRPMGMGSPPGSTGSMMMGIMKKKRGRPRKYAPDGSLVMPLALMPPMSMGSPTGEFTLTSGESITMSMKRGRGRGSVGMSSFVKQYARPDYESAPPPPPPSTLGELSPCSYGGGFMPHIINVAAGEDVTMKIISFSQQGPRAICILSATGVISNVTLRQPDSSGGTLTYEGRFELLSLSGSFMPNDIGGARSRSGGMSVSLASPDGRVVGGGVAGLLVAASPVQVVVGSFMPSYQSELKNKKAKLDSASVNSPPATAPHSGNLGESYNGGQGQHSTGILKPSITTTSVRESWASLHPMSDARNSTDINLSLPNA